MQSHINVNDSKQKQFSLGNQGMQLTQRSSSFGNYEEIVNPLDLPTELNESEGPTLFYCMNCKMDSVSVCEYEATNQTFLCAFLLFFILNIFGCFIPYTSNACKDRKQFCPKCRRIVGIYSYNACAC